MLLLLCSIITGTATAQESGDKERFFPANSIRCTNVITVNFAEMDQTVPKETIYYEMWTGNDTIVDGKPCVTLWQQFDRDITTITDHPHKAFTPELEGVIYEADNGYVYFKYMNDDGNDWEFLYDFSSPNRNEGDTICLGMNDMEETIYEGIDQISTCTLHNGREVQVAEGLMYGIGYQSYPFFFPNYMWVMINAYVPIYDPINFYRNGELLWGVPYDMHSKLAANERDLDVDGKKWHIRTQVPYIDDRYTNDVFMWIEGDTIVEDIRYKKLYKQTRNVKDSSMGTIEVGYCRQEGDKYYQDGKLMFDFGLGEGDMFATSTENEEAGFFYTVVSIGDTLLLDGLPRKYMVIAPSYEGMTKSNHTDIWIEGIGSLSMGIFENDFYYMDGLKKELQCCSYNDIYIYKKKEESKTYLVTEGKQWVVYYEQSWNQDQPVVTHTFRLQGDTVINGFTYKKKWMSVEKDLSDWSLFPSYMREENGKVYVMNSRGEEALWFDYNAQVGDTLCLTSKQATQQCYGLVTSIDDVVLEHSDGKQRKRYEVVLGREAMSGGVYFTDECIYIHEDVGMFNSPIYGYGLGDHTLFNYGNKFKLLCVHDNGIALYQSPDGCYKEGTSKTYLVTEGKQWAVERYTMGGVQGVYSYCLQGDTIINGKEYKIEHEGCGKDLSGMKPSGRYMREENGRVYSYVHTERYKDEDEVLFFDFNLEDGDTIVYIPDVYSLHVMDVYDAVVPHSDGQSRKCYEVELWNIREEGVYDSDDFGGTFVEGIGNLCSGLSDPGFGLVGSNQRLLYVKQGDTILYQREEEKEEPKTYLVTEGKEWQFRYFVVQYIRDVTYKLSGDTIIDGHTYKKEWVMGWNGSSQMELTQGFLREENGKVYRKEYNKEEYLWFDYNANIGDTIFYVNSFVKVVGHSDTTIICNGVSRTYKGVDVQVGGYDVNISTPDSSTNYEHFLFPGYIATFYEELGLFTTGDIVRSPSFNMEGCVGYLLYVKQGDTILYQREEEKEEPILPIAVDGMEWEIKVGQSYYISDVQMWINGDVTVDNIPCKRLYTRTTQLWDGGIEDLEIGYCYQDGDKYYQNGKLMFDFGLDVGDMFTTELGNKIMVSNVSDTILNDGVKRKMLTVKYSGRTDKWVEGIGSLTMGIYTNDFTTYGVMKELQNCSYNGEYIYDKNLPDPSRPTTKRGYGIYHGDTYLHAYTINEAEAVTDSTDFARWNDKTVIYFDVDTIGPNAFSGATFRQGQILYFTERLNTIFKDAFTDLNIIKRTSQESLMSDDLTLVFAGANPPGIDKNYIMDYADSTCHINYVVPDLETYIKDDIQWTYTTLMTIDDFVRGYISPENEVTVSDTTEADASVDNANAGEVGPTAPPTIRASVRPRGDIPVRIGEGENKDIYSRAPAWQYYTVEVVVTDCHADTLYTASQECRAHGQCDFVIELPYYPDGGYVYLHSRSIDMFGRATEWAVLKVQVETAIDELLQPGTPNVYYDLQGRPVANPTRGIYIRNGRKVVVVR